MSVSFLQRLATPLSFIALLGAIALPLGSAAIWYFWDELAPGIAGNLPFEVDLSQLSASARLGGFGVLLTGALVQAYGLLGLRESFQEAAKGRALSERAMYGFRRFAWVTLAMALYGIVQRTALVLIISLDDAAPGGTLSIEFGTLELKAAFIGVLLVFLGHVFAQGAAAKAENDAFL